MVQNKISPNKQIKDQLLPVQMAFSWLLNGAYPHTNWDHPPSTDDVHRESS